MVALERGWQLCSSAVSHVARAQFLPAVAAAREGLDATPFEALRLQRGLHNVLGLALHGSGDYVQAHAHLESAVKLAEECGRQGAAHDAFVDVAGALGDLAANHIRLEQPQDAEKLLKRGAYMLKRAYRPSPTAQACLQSVDGWLAHARGDFDTAFTSHQASYSLLTTTGMLNNVDACQTGRLPQENWPPSRGRSEPLTISTWTHAAMGGSIAALLSQQRRSPRLAASADRLAASALEAISPDELDARCAPLARSNAALAMLATARSDLAAGGNKPASSDTKCNAASQLEEVAADLELLLGPQHSLVSKARLNAAAAAACRLDELDPLWQPALGAGLMDL